MTTLDEIAAAQAALTRAMIMATSDQATIANLTAELEACRDSEIPLPPDDTLIGVNQGGVDDFELVGGPMQVVRVFDQGNWESQVRGHLNAGRGVILSVKSDTTQARAASLFSDEGVWLCRRHEPENDGISKEAWRQEQLKLAPLNGAFRLLPILMAVTLREWVTPALLDDIPYEGIGFDCYLRAVPWTRTGFDSNMKPCLQHIDALNLPALLCEFGVPTKVGNAVSDPDAQAAEIHKALEYRQTYDVAAYCYFNESVTKDTTRDYRVNARPLALAELNGAAG